MKVVGAISASDASYVEEPVFEKEQLIIADIEASKVIEESLTLDVSGHNSPPDVFEVASDRKRKGDYTLLRFFFFLLF
jgi:nitrilase